MGKNGVDKQKMKLVSVLWKCIFPVFLAIFSDETTDVEESSTAFVFRITLGPLPQKPHSQPSDRTYENQSGDEESSDVKTSRRRIASGSREDANGLGCHRRIHGRF